MRKTIFILGVMVLAFTIVSCGNSKDTKEENADENQKTEQNEQIESNDQGKVITDETKDLDAQKVIDNAKVVESEPVEGDKKAAKTTQENEVKVSKKASDVIGRSKVVEEEKPDMTQEKQR